MLPVQWWQQGSSWCDGSSDRSFMVDSLSYFSFQPMLHNWCNKGCGICILKYHAANQWWQQGSSWCDGSSDRSFMVDSYSYFSFQPMLHNWCNKGCGICILKYLAANQWWQQGSSWCDGSSDRSFMVDSSSYFSFQPMLHNWCNKGRGMCYPVCRLVHI